MAAWTTSGSANARRLSDRDPRVTNVMESPSVASSTLSRISRGAAREKVDGVERRVPRRDGGRAAEDDGDGRAVAEREGARGDGGATGVVGGVEVDPAGHDRLRGAGSEKRREVGARARARRLAERVGSRARSVQTRTRGVAKLARATGQVDEPARGRRRPRRRARANSKVAIGPFDKTRAITPSSVGHAGQRRARNASRAAKGTPAAVPDSAARANALDAIPRAAVPRARCGATHRRARPACRRVSSLNNESVIVDDREACAE